MNGATFDDKKYVNFPDQLSINSLKLKEGRRSGLPQNKESVSIVHVNREFSKDSRIFYGNSSAAEAMQSLMRIQRKIK